MKTGLVGLKLVGKTTIFNILTGAQGGVGPGARKEPNLGMARVPDDRLYRLADLYRPVKTTPATAQYVDLPGVEPGEMRESGFLGGLRQADALAHVVRAFHDESVPLAGSGVDPARDIENMELEMILADLFQLEKRLERLEKDLKKMRNKELEAEQALLFRFRDQLRGERPLREVALSPEDERLVRGFTFLSQKPILHIVNMDEADAPHLGRVGDHFGLGRWSDRPGVVVTGVCGKIEEELSRLSPAEAAEFMADMGIAESGMVRLVRENYRLLGLLSFFTVGEDECRAWTIRAGTIAHQAAGVIHSDLEKGFIRAEVVRHEDLLAAGSFQALKDRGLFRLEGKEYIVQDGDVMHVRFNV